MSELTSEEEYDLTLWDAVAKQTPRTGRVVLPAMSYLKLRALMVDARRYQWLVGARTKDQCVDENAGSKPALPQDRVIAELASWYCTKQEADAAIDAARGEVGS